MYRFIVTILLLTSSVFATAELPKRVRNRPRVAPNSLFAGDNTDDPDNRDPNFAVLVVSADGLNSMSGTFDIPTLEGTGSADVAFVLGAFGSCSSGSEFGIGIHMTTKNGPQYHPWVLPPNGTRKYLNHAFPSISPGDTMQFEMGYGDDGSAGLLLVDTVTNDGYSNQYEDVSLCASTATWGVIKNGHHLVNFDEIDFPSPAFGVSGEPGDWSDADVEEVSLYNQKLKRELVSASGSSTSINFDYVKSQCRRSEGSALC